MAVVTGELIRAMNYVEDITATLRRICIYIPGMSAPSWFGTRISVFIVRVEGSSSPEARVT